MGLLRFQGIPVFVSGELRQFEMVCCFRGGYGHFVIQEYGQCILCKICHAINKLDIHADKKDKCFCVSSNSKKYMLHKMSFDSENTAHQVLQGQETKLKKQEGTLWQEEKQRTEKDIRIDSVCFW